MRMPKKKWFIKIITNMSTMIITYTLIRLIHKRSFLSIEWDAILVMSLVHLITSILMIDKEDLN